MKKKTQFYFTNETVTDKLTCPQNYGYKTKQISVVLGSLLLIKPLFSSVAAQGYSWEIYKSIQG